jgi:phage shock protein PspC (stress-responsive transcriptional regulator)
MNEQSTNQANQQSGMDRFFAALRGIDMRRRSDDRWIGGVCSGLADRLGVDPVIVRAGLVLLSLIAGVGVTLYLLAWALIPNDRNEIVAERAVRDADGGSIVVVALAALGLLGGSAFGGPWWTDHNGWGFPGFAILIGLLIWWLVKRSGPRPDADQKVRSYQSGTYPSGTHPSRTYASGTQQSDAYPPGTQHSGAYPAGAQQSGQQSGPQQFGPQQSGTAVVGTAPLPRTAAALPSPGSPVTGASTFGSSTTTPAPVVPRKPRRRSGGPLLALLAIGLALATYGSLIWAGNAAGWTGDHQSIALAGSLASMGLLLVGLGVAGWRGGFASFLTILLAIATWSSMVVPPGLDITGRVGDVTWKPASATVGVTPDSYRLGAGTGVLDLRGLPTEGLSPGTPVPTIPAYVGVGELTILVPPELTVRFDGHVGLGEIILPAETQNNGHDGTDISRSTVVGNGPAEVLVDAGVGIGSLTVVKG